MSDPKTPWSVPLRLADLPRRTDRDILLTPDAEVRAALAEYLGIIGIRKLRLEGALVPVGRSDWRFAGRIGATVVQACVVTLDPVTTRIDETVERLYSADADVPADPGEIEMPEDDTIEPLPAVLDLSAVMAEALALALPPYPRAPGAGSGDSIHAAEGVNPMRDEDALPFAGLRDALKANQSDPTGETD
ncbi:YceD family protein [Oceaniglobus indicus]|uniref:YceD family protein n=1 Tax=Oceaniglobus indicus TaxID=2047749 RepID=UPI000C198E81|nr:DUF177 domain-containing protein [Oceaniglobus indicus]